MKKIILFALLFAGIRSYAQDINPFTFGPMVSMTSTSLSADPGFEDQIAGSGYNIGGFARVKILFLYGQLEGSFGSKSSSVTVAPTGTGSVDNNSVTFKLNGLDLSLIAGMKLFGLGNVSNFRIFTGYNLNNYSDITYSVDGNEFSADNVNDNNSSIIGGVGIDVLRLTLDLKYLWGLSDLDPTGNSTVTTNVVNLTVGFKIL